MKVNCLKNCILIFIILGILILLSGCVEVTPQSGTQNASAYGPGTTGGDMKDLVKGQQSNGATQTQGSQLTQPTGSQTEPTVPVPPIPNETFVKVTPMNYDELKPDTPTSYLPYNRPVSTLEQQYVTIYNITNQTFKQNASAYAYDLNTPPLYVDLDFYPKMVTDELEVYKRTGDKEGTVKYSKIRPSQDAWFEMRVYDLNNRQEILREGYGKTYGLTNKTTAIRKAGKFQFDFMGDQISADITMKIPINSSGLSMMSNVTNLIEDQKKKSTLLPQVFLQSGEFGQGWQQTGDLTHTQTQYSSIHTLPSSGLTITQDITRYSRNQEINDAFSQTHKKNAGEKQISILAGDEGYGFESIRKTGIVFKQGLYLVQITSYSIPPVSLNELKRYATVISGKITQN